MKTTPNGMGKPPISNLSEKENLHELTQAGVQCEFLT